MVDHTETPMVDPYKAVIMLVIIENFQLLHQDIQLSEEYLSFNAAVENLASVEEETKMNS
jgi:hypothetical protein